MGTEMSEVHTTLRLRELFAGKTQRPMQDTTMPVMSASTWPSSGRGADKARSTLESSPLPLVEQGEAFYPFEKVARTTI